MKTAMIAAAFAISATPALACGGKSQTTSETTTYTATLASHHEESGDIVEVADEAGSFTTLLAAAEAAGLVEALKGDGPLTVFAPTDEAFDALPEGTVDTLLMPENQDQLAAVLKLHVISGKVKSEDLAGEVTEAETLDGMLTIDATDGVMVEAPGSTATVVTPDVMASNGVIHIIDTVLLPE